MTASKLLTLSALTCSIAAWSASEARAQPGAPSRPTVSPYLNLLRQGGGSPGLNYYGLVRPEVNNRQTAQALQSATAANQRTITDLLNGGELPVTGTASGFLTHGSYFMTQGSGGSSGGGGGRNSSSSGGGGGGRR